MRVGKKICSICKRIVDSPLEWWDEPYNACSNCIKRIMKQVTKEKNKTKEIFNKNETINGLK